MSITPPTVYYCNDLILTAILKATKNKGGGRDGRGLCRMGWDGGPSERTVAYSSVQWPRRKVRIPLCV